MTPPLLFVGLAALAVMAGASSALAAPFSYRVIYPGLVPAAGASPGAPAPAPASAPLACTSPWGTPVASGEALLAYQAATAPYAGTCLSEQRACNNGVLAGSYAYENCDVAVPRVCGLPWGGSLAHGGTVQAYQSGSVPSGSTCVAETRSCIDSVLSGTFANPGCTVLTPLPASLIGDGVSTAGACADGATGCATLSATDKHANLYLSADKLSATSDRGSSSVRATRGKSAGKWYWEYRVASAGTSNAMLGIGTSAMSLSGYPGGTSVEGYGYWGNNGSIYHAGSSSSGAAAYGNGTVIGVALDADNRSVTFYKNGVLQKTMSGITATTWYPALSPQTTGIVSTISANFGQANFVYAPPLGYNAGMY